MDLTLLWVAIALLVVGFALVVIGERMKPLAAIEAEPPSWSEIIRRALGYMLTAIGQIINGPSSGHRVQGAGSALVVFSFFVLVAWLVRDLLPSLGRNGPAASPSQAP